MKKCPQCGREYDLTMSFCLDDGSELLYGPASGKSEPPASAGGFLSSDEPVTAVFGVPPSGGSGSEPGAVATGFRGGEDQTRQHINTTDQTAILHTGAEAEPRESLGELSERQSHSAHRAAKPLVAVGLAVILLVGGFFGYRYFSSTIKQIESIAVMPFENKSSDADSDYLSDGLAESLIYRLSQLPNLKVSPTSSVFRYKGKETDPQTVSKELGVDSVLTGRITQRGNNLMISVNLVDTRNGKSLWGEQYERKMSELLATQREIAAEITNSLKLKMSGEGEQKLAKKYTDNNEAYQLYLKGTYHYAKRTKDDLNTLGIEYFQQAIALDPNFALAYVGLANSYAILPLYAYLPAKEAIPQSKSAAQKALAIDPTLADAHAGLAYSLAVYDWNWAEAESEYKRALELNPNVPEIHYRYALHYLIPVGRTAEAIAEINRALELEPLSLAMGANLSGAHMYARQFDKALEQAKKTYNLDPNHPTAHIWLGNIYAVNGNYAEAIALCEESLRKDPSNQYFLWIAGYAYAKSGRRQAAAGVIKKFKEIAETQYVAPYNVAVVFAAMGEKDQAFGELEKAFVERDGSLTFLKVDPFVDSLRDDPRFKDLLKRMNLPE